MKILIISTSDLRGGAAKVAFQLGNWLKKNGDEVVMYVSQKSSTEDWVVESKTSTIIKKLNHIIDRLPGILLSGDKNVPFTLGLMGEDLEAVIDKFHPDIINIHWTGKGFISFKNIVKIAKKKDLIWTLHDWSAFSGGLFFKSGDKFNNPLLKALIRWNISREKKLIGDSRLNIVTPSKYLKKLAQTSPILKNSSFTVINNGVDKDVFYKHDRIVELKNLNLNPTKKYLLFGSVNIKNDRAKGFDLLLEVLMGNKAWIEKKNIGMLAFGSENPFDHTFLKDFLVEKHFLGYIKDEAFLSKIYSAASLFILPSKIENYPLVALECLASGTPVAAFEVGGIPEIIDNSSKGVLTPPFDIKEMKLSMKYILKKDWIVSDKDIPTVDSMGETYKKLFIDIKANSR